MVMQDIRWALHVMRRNLGVTIAVVLSLGLAIGANTAVFSVVNAFLLRPLAIDDMDRMVRVREDFSEPGGDPDTRSVTASNYFAWKEHNQVFEGMAAGTGISLNMTGSGDPELISGAAVTADFFPLLGIQPVLGRTFLPEEDRPGANHVVLIGYNLWNQRFGGDRGIVGKVLTLNGQPHTVIGVMPRGLRHPYEADMWVPLALVNDPANTDGYYVPARIKKGITLERAQAEMTALVRQLAEQNPVPNGPTSANLSPLRKEFVHDLDKTLFLLTAAAAFVLLIACANVSNLLLAQSLGQGTEVAVRVALGASRRRLVRQFLTYSIILALFGGALGVLLTFWSVKPLVALGPVEALGEFDIEPRMDLPTLGFTILSTLVVGIIFGVLPALRVSRADPNQYLKEGGNRARTMGAGGRRVLGAFVVAEVALSVVLQSFLKRQNEPRGFDLNNVLSFSVAFPEAQYPDIPSKAAFLNRALDRLRAVPGLEGVAATSTQPLSPGQIYASFNPEGQPANNARGAFLAHHRAVSAGYFETMKIPLLSGRTFTRQDIEEPRNVLIVSKSFADHYWPGQNPIGKRIKRGTYDSDNPWITIVGVVGTLKETQDTSDLETATSDAWYMPYSQNTQRFLDSMDFVLRSDRDPKSLVPAVRAAMREVDPNQPIYDIATLEERLGRLTGQERLNAMIYSVLGLFGLVLAALGIHGVLAFSVNQRLREIGIRSAMGAQPGQLRGMVMRSALIMIGIGLALGLAGSFVLARFLSAKLYEIDAHDPATLVGAMLILGLIALVSSFFPANRAARVDPIRALRYE
jgi:putative ABC transport system permease protein